MRIYFCLKDKKRKCEYEVEWSEMKWSEVKLYLNCCKCTFSSVAVHLPFLIELYLTASLMGSCSILASYFVNKPLAINLLNVKVIADELTFVRTILFVAFLKVEIILSFSLSLSLSLSIYLSTYLYIYLSLALFFLQPNRTWIQSSTYYVSFIRM